MNEFADVAEKLFEAFKAFKVQGFSQSEAMDLTRTMLVELMGCR